ncbi:hypothetical protein [Chitinophaga defluvii]|uniref:Conjugative transposon protein TraK n=1 Tax=Chitinophaga defluvii TaxID=3163343 RepID=A0ABV2T6L6_9BACT
MKRKENKAHGEQEEKRNILKEKMSKGVHVVQSSWAQWMLRRTRSIPPNRMRIILILFVVSVGSYCAWLTYGGITGKSVSFFSITPIKKPAHATGMDSSQIMIPHLSDAEYKRIGRFRLYMDSLARSPTGKRIYDSIIHHRPGLMDSIGYIEKYYRQFKNK